MAITSGKGGVGKTMVSANLACALARRGLRVLVLDADLGLANLDVVLNLQPSVTLHHVVSGQSTLSQALIDAPGGFKVLLAGSGLVEYSRLTPELRERLAQILQEATARFDVILLDTGAGISDVVLFTLSLAQDIVVVATPEPTSLTDAYATIKVLATLQQRRDLLLVVNQTTQAGEGLGIRQQLQGVVDRYVNPLLDGPVQLRLLGELPLDPQVREAVRRRRLVLDLASTSPVSQALRATANRLLAWLKPQAVATTPMADPATNNNTNASAAS